MQNRKLGDSLSEINGETLVYGVIGSPIKHTLSPLIHKKIAEALSKNIAYLPFQVENSSLKSAIEGAFSLGIMGLNVTIPHKQSVMPFLSDIDEAAKRVGAVNTLKREKHGYVGYNTDILGLAMTLEAASVSITGKPVVIFGAGGSAYAASVYAAEQKASQIVIINRTIENAKLLANHIRTYYNINAMVCVDEKDVEGAQFELAIQTTSLGFSANEGRSPVKDKAFFENVNTAIDFIYTPWETFFLKQAKMCKRQAINGFDILIFQAIKAYEVWHNVNLSMYFAKRISNEVKAELALFSVK